MSLSDHRYTARIAPTSQTAIDAIHAGAAIVDERGERVTESFASGALIWPTKPVPVLIDHDERFPVGFVTNFAERDGWHEATLVLNMDKPLADVAQEILRVGTPISLGAKSLLRDESLADLGLAIPVKRHLAAVLEEVSILSPGVVPAYRGAKVIRLGNEGRRATECASVSARRPLLPVDESARGRSAVAVAVASNRGGYGS